MAYGSAEALDLTGIRAKLLEGDDAVRLASLASLLRPGLATPELTEAVEACLEGGNENVRRAAVMVLANQQPPPVPALVRALDERHPISLRVLAALGLGKAGANAAPAIEELGKCLTARDDLLRWHAAFALSRIGPAALPPLMLRLRSTDPLVVSAALDAMGWIGAGAKTAFEEVKCLAASPLPAIRLACHSAMVMISGDGTLGLPMLVAALEDKDASARVAALERIGHLRAAACESAPAILRCLTGQSSQVRAAAALALARVEARAPHIVAALTQALADPEPDVGANAAIALASFGPAAASALPALHLMQQSRDSRSAAIARAAMERIQEPSRM